MNSVYGSKLLASDEERLASLRTPPSFLSGDFGAGGVVPEEDAASAHVPGMVRVAYADGQTSDGQPTWSVGDSLTFAFDAALNVKPDWPTRGGKSFVDALFAFSASLGDDYTGC